MGQEGEGEGERHYSLRHEPLLLFAKRHYALRHEPLLLFTVDLSPLSLLIVNWLWNPIWFCLLPNYFTLLWNSPEVLNTQSIRLVCIFRVPQEKK